MFRPSDEGTIGADVTLDELSLQLTRGVSNLRADVHESAIMVEQLRDELRYMHKLMGDIQQHLADVPKREDFDELM